MIHAAHLKSRFLALLLGTLIIWMIVALYIVIGVTLYSINKTVSKLNEWHTNVYAFLLVSSVAVYFIWTENSSHHATFGKRKMHIKVANLQGEAPTLRQIILRNGMKLIPWQVAHMVVIHVYAQNLKLDFSTNIVLVVDYILSLLWLGFVIIRRNYRGIHDWVARTEVVSLEVK